MHYRVRIKGCKLHTSKWRHARNTNLESKECGSSMFSIIFFLGFHLDSQGLAAAKIEVLAFSWQMIPALAILNVCCSITCEIKFQKFNSIWFWKPEFFLTYSIRTSWRILLVESFILSNSSIQQIPLSANTRAPLSRQTSNVPPLITFIVYKNKEKTTH